MSKKFDTLSPELTDFIAHQKMFFVGTAAAEGRVNISPKGMDTLRVVNSNQVVWLNLTGSGNETSAHIQLNNRMTILFCAFEGKPMILRLYGSASIYHEQDKEFSNYIRNFPETAGARQIFLMDIDLVQTSCGFAVPYMDYREDRTLLKDWATKQGKEGIRAYWDKKNRESIDGYETNILS